MFSGTDLHELYSFYAFEPRFSGGVNVALGDIDGDGAPTSSPARDQAAARASASSAATTCTSCGASCLRPGFAGGVYVAAGDINGDGRSDLITGAGAEGGGPHVRVFSGVDRTLASFYA